MHTNTGQREEGHVATVCGDPRGQESALPCGAERQSKAELDRRASETDGPSFDGEQGERELDSELLTARNPPSPRLCNVQLGVEGKGQYHASPSLSPAATNTAQPLTPQTSGLFTVPGSTPCGETAGILLAWRFLLHRSITYFLGHSGRSPSDAQCGWAQALCTARAEAGSQTPVRTPKCSSWAAFQ